MASSPATCAGCQLPQDQLSTPLRPCSKCFDVQYCSRECQKADWRTHKSACALSVEVRFHINKPFTALKNGTWLTNRPERDVYQLLCDIFRLRRQDTHTRTPRTTDTDLANFRRFLESATSIDASRSIDKKLLPTWWTEDNIERCMAVGENDRYAKITTGVAKRDIEEYYGGIYMAMQLERFGSDLDGWRMENPIVMEGGVDALEVIVLCEATGASAMPTRFRRWPLIPH